jgi:hypothetical protein
MKQRALVFGSAALLALFSGSCQGELIGSVRGGRRLVVDIVPPSDTGSRTQPLALSVETPTTFRVQIRALTQEGMTDSAFTGYVRLSSKPGALEPIDDADAAGRNVLLTEGLSPEVDVQIVNAYGTTFIFADDLGYIPVDPLRDPPPACANGIDDDGDGKIDFPADEGCAFANDDAEQGGSYAQGASPAIYFALPRVADMRGLVCRTASGGAPQCSGSGATPYSSEQLLLDTGTRIREDGTQGFDFNVVVTRISSNGFYVTDVNDTRGGFRSVFAFNFNAPPRMQVCDRMRSLSGLANEFFGFTQLSYPTWTLEEWEPSQRPCLAPPATVLRPAPSPPEPPGPNDIIPASLLRISGDVVRVETLPDRELVARVTPKFGPGDVTRGPGGAFVPAEDATNCDFNRDGNITFAPGNPEGECSTSCAADPECTEYSNYVARNTFRITVTDASGRASAIQADATASNTFDPLASRGQEIRAFTGTLHYFSGGAQYTIQARCLDDIVLDPAAQPLGADICETTADCPPPLPNAAPDDGFECVPLAGGRACRTARTRQPPPLACVQPRTVLDNNPQ